MTSVKDKDILAGIGCPECGGDVEYLPAEIGKCVDCAYSFDIDEAEL